MPELHVEDPGIHKGRPDHADLSLPKRALVLFVVLLGLQAVFLLSSIGAAALPKGEILDHIDASSDSTLVQYFDYDHKVLGSAVSFDNNRFIEDFANQDDYGGDAVKAAALNRIEYTMPWGANTFEYFRYWHGWQLPVFLLLMVGNLDLVSVALGLFALGCGAFFLWQLRWYLGWAAAGAFSVLVFFSTNVLGNFMGDLLLCLSISVVTLCCAIGLLVGRNPRRSIFWQDCICLASGSLFCFFDFFTIPSYAIALAVFSAMVASGCLQSSFKRSVVLFLRFSALFLVGFVITWASKWAFAAVYLGVPAVVHNVLNEVNVWSDQTMDPSAGSLQESFPRTFALAKSAWYVLNNGNPIRTPRWNIVGFIGVIAFVIGAVLIVVSMRRAKRDDASIAGGIGGLLLPSLFVPVAIILMYRHVLWHTGIFGYKPWAFVFADVACIGIYLFCAERRARSGELTHSSVPDTVQ